MTGQMPLPRAQFGAGAFKSDIAGGKYVLPPLYPRLLGANATGYLKEVVETGLASDMVDRFETAFAHAMGVKHCITAPGCNMVLALLAHCLRFDAGDEIVFSSISDYGTIAGFVHAGLIPVFADVEPGGVNVSAQTIEPCISDRTRAICVVHKTGLMCDMDPIMHLAKQRGLVVIEDACQAILSSYKGRLAGTIGDIGAFSFDSEKTMGADIGGCFITNDDELADFARLFGASRGAVSKPLFGRRHIVPGLAIRMPQCTAAICLAQLEEIPDRVRHIDAMARLLTRRLAEIPGITPLTIPEFQETYSAWMMSFSIDPAGVACDADQFAAELAEAGIPNVSTARYYHVPDASPFLEQWARSGRYPFCRPHASREYSYRDICPNARQFLDSWIRWSSFNERYIDEHCEQAAAMVRQAVQRHGVPRERDAK